MPISLPIESPPGGLEAQPSDQYSIALAPPPPALTQPLDVALATASKGNASIDDETERISSSKVSPSSQKLKNGNNVSCSVGSEPTSNNLSSAEVSNQDLGCKSQTLLLSLTLYSLFLAA